MADTDFATEGQINSLVSAVAGGLNNTTVGDLSDADGRVTKLDGIAAGATKNNLEADTYIEFDGRTITDADILAVGRGAPDEQTISVKYYDSAGVGGSTIVTITVSVANANATVSPPTFSQVMGVGSRLVFARETGTGNVPIIGVNL